MIDCAGSFDVDNANSPTYEVKYFPGTPLSRRMKILKEGHFLDNKDDLKYSTGLLEFLIVTSKSLRLQNDPHSNALRIPVENGPDFFISQFKKATFFYLICNQTVFILGVIFSWDHDPVIVGGGGNNPISSITGRFIKFIKSIRNGRQGFFDFQNQVELLSVQGAVRTLFKELVFSLVVVNLDSVAGDGDGVDGASAPTLRRHSLDDQIVGVGKSTSEPSKALIYASGPHVFSHAQFSRSNSFEQIYGIIGQRSRLGHHYQFGAVNGVLYRSASKDDLFSNRGRRGREPHSLTVESLSLVLAKVSKEVAYYGNI
jgi:hypothetical protein